MTLTILSFKMQYIIKKEKMRFIKDFKCGIFSLVFVIKLRGRMIGIFLVGLQKTDKGFKTKLIL